MHSTENPNTRKILTTMCVRTCPETYPLAFQSTMPRADQYAMSEYCFFCLFTSEHTLLPFHLTQQCALFTEVAQIKCPASHTLPKAQQQQQDVADKMFAFLKSRLDSPS